MATAVKARPSLSIIVKSRRLEVVTDFVSLSSAKHLMVCRSIIANREGGSNPRIIVMPFWSLLPDPPSTANFPFDMVIMNSIFLSSCRDFDSW